MAKTYEELLEQAAIVRDETAAGKNTAARVGGALADAVDYVKGLQDAHGDILEKVNTAVSTATMVTAVANSAKTYANNAVNTAKQATATAEAANATAEAAQGAADQISEDLNNNAYNWATDQDAGYSANSQKYYHGLMSAADKEKVDGLDARFELIDRTASNQETRIGALENPPAPDYVEMIVEAPVAKHYALFYDARCLGWLEIDGEEETVPEVTGNKSVKYYAALSPGRHVVRFRPKEGNMSDGTPWKERAGMLGWCSGNQVTEVTLPEGWTVINTKMFEGADSLRRVNLPSTITEVRYGAFGNCAALEEIVLPASVERIEHIIAHDCPALKRIVLGGRNVEINGTLAQTCTELDCVEFRAGGTSAFKTSNNSFINLPKLGRFIIGGNLPSFECDRPFTSTGYVGSSLSADTRWLFTADNVNPSGTVWEASLINICGFTVKGRRSYELV
jgi:hypothetical protein